MSTKAVKESRRNRLADAAAEFVASASESSFDAAMFFERFELLTDACNATTTIRAMIRTLAVNARITTPLESDGNARDYFDDLQSEEQELPVGLPASWLNINFATVGDQRLGKMLDKGSNSGSLRPYLRNTNVQWFRFELDDVKQIRLEDAELDEFQVKPGDLLICEGGEPGRCAIWSDAQTEMYFQKALHRVRPRLGVLPQYVALYLKAAADNGSLATCFTGATIKHLTGKSLRGFRINIPPLAEQKRIVSKVDELMGLCDRLEALEAERKERHASLSRAALTRFADSPTPTNLQFLFHNSFDVEPNELRETILSMAVLGKLVPAEANADNRPGFDANDDALCEQLSIPTHWGACDIGAIIDSIGSGWSPKCDETPAGTNEWGVLKTTAVQTLRYDEFANKRLPPNLTARPDCEVQDGDILFTRAGPFNRVGIVCVARPTRAKLMLSDKIIRIHLKNFVYPEFAALALNTGKSSEVIQRLKSGMAASQVNISQTKLRSIPLPIPPLAEQKRIVAKVDELMALVDQLEQQLAHSRTLGQQLLEAVVANLTQDQG